MIMRLLRAIARPWAAPPPPRPSPVFEALIDGRWTRVCAMRPVGLHLECRIGTGSRLIKASGAVDPDHFWALWKSLGGRAVWADGTEYQPPPV